MSSEDAHQSTYRSILENLKNSFPQPVSDRVHDAYFVFSILRALDQLDGMKSEVPMFGKPTQLNYSEAHKDRIAESPQDLEGVSNHLVSLFEGIPIWSHPKVQINVVPPPSIASIIGALLPTIYNVNMVSDDSSYQIGVAEARVIAMVSDLVGYDTKKSSGIFTFGGTGTNMYGIRIGIEKALPGAMENGIREDLLVFSSGQSHYSRLSITGWLGLGERCLVEIPTHRDNNIQVEELEKQARKALVENKKIAAFLVTLGTTDAFGLDDLEAVVKLRDQLVQEFKLEYTPHIHADAVIGWAWSVFNDYDFDRNSLGFRKRTVRALNGAIQKISKLHLADSFGIDFHKTGFAPYISSAFVCKNKSDLALLARDREKMPYLFQTGVEHPGIYSLETSRSGCGVLAALGNMLLLGKNGLRALLGHLVEMAEVLRENLEGNSHTTVLNGGNFGTVTLFRVYPDDVDTWTVKDREFSDPDYQEQLLKNNEYNQKIFNLLHEEAMRGEGILLSTTDCYRKSDFGTPILALKSYVLSPFVTEGHMEQIVQKVLEARQKIKD